MTILVAVADDRVRDRVLEVAFELGRGLGQELYVVHIVEEQTADTDARQIRDQLRDRATNADVVVTVSVEHIGHTGPRQGPRVGQDLLDVAADVDISHIVLGHTSKGLLEGLAKGSTAFSVANAADIPVTIVPERYGDEKET